MHPRFLYITGNEPKTEKTELCIEPPADKHQGIVMNPLLAEVFPPSFSMLILGKPGSGKSHLISQMLTRQSFFCKRFERILYVGPTKYPGIVQDQGNWLSVLDLAWIKARINECVGWASNLLIVFDDIVSQLPNTHRNQLQNLYYTRRHIMPNGTISIMFTTQKYTTAPAWLRLCTNSLISFGITSTQCRKIKQELFIKKELDFLSKYLVGMGKHEFIVANITTGQTFNYKFQKL